MLSCGYSPVSATFRARDLAIVVQDCGPQALGIVTLINFLVGLIIAFVGAVQLQRFGASIYVADLVAIATVRELGCIMTGHHHGRTHRLGIRRRSSAR